MVKKSVIRVLLADDHQIMLEGLRLLLSKEDDMEVAGYACTGREVVQKAANLLPDVVVMDVRMPDMDGIKASELISKKYEGIKILVLSAYSHKHIINKVLESGADGFIMKDSAFKELAEGIRMIINDKYYVCSKTKDLLADNFIEQYRKEGGQELSNRECEILRLLAEGKNSKEIGRELGVSYKTVDACRRDLMYKLDLNSLADIVKYAIRKGISSL